MRRGTGTALHKHPRAGSCLHFSHECLQRIIVAVRVCWLGMELLPSGGILCRNVGQFHIAGIFLFILKVPGKNEQQPGQHMVYSTGLSFTVSGWVKVPTQTTEISMDTRGNAEIFLFTIVHVKSSKWWQGKEVPLNRVSLHLFCRLPSGTGSPRHLQAEEPQLSQHDVYIYGAKRRVRKSTLSSAKDTNLSCLAPTLRTSQSE